MKKMRIARTIFSVEFAFVMFVLSGVFKESIGIPWDLTAVFLVITVIAVAFKKLKNPTFRKIEFIPAGFYVAFLGLLLLSYMVTPGEVYATEKIIKFVLLTSPTFLLPLLFVDSKESLFRIFDAISIVAVILSAIALPSVIQRGSSIGFIGFNSGNYQGLARVGGMGLIILVAKFFSARQRILSLIGIAIVAAVLIGTGSRMPLIAVISILIFLVFKAVKYKKGKIYYHKGLKVAIPALLVFGAFMTVLFQKGFFATMLYRLKVLLTEQGGGDSATGRTERMNAAWDLFSDSPFFGGGLGSFPLAYNGMDISDYPHNLFLEFMAEMGLLGLILLILFLMATVWLGLSVYRKHHKSIGYSQIVLFALFGYYFLNTMVSGDINGNRLLFFFAVCLMISPALNQRHKEQTVD